MRKLPPELDEEIYATVEALPNKPSADVQARADEYFSNKHALVYRMDTAYIPLEDRRRKMIRATCTACGEDTYYEPCETLEGCHSGGYSCGIGFVDLNGLDVSCFDRCECSRCGASVEAVHTSRIRSVYQIDHLYVGEILNVRGHLVLLAWFFSKEVDKLGQATVKAYQNEGILLVGGEPARVCGWGKNIRGTGFQRKKWLRYSNYTDSFGVWSREEFIYDPEVIYTTDAAKCGIDKFLTDGGLSMRPGAYLWLWCKCPAVENLVTSGQTDYVKRVIDECTVTSGYYYEKQQFRIGDVPMFIDFKKVKPHEMMRCEKHERELWREIGMYKFAFKGFLYDTYGQHVSRERLDRCEAEGIGSWREVLRKRGKWRPPMQRTFNYIDREKRKWFFAEYKRERLPKKSWEDKLREDMCKPKRYGSSCAIGPSFLNDYWNMLEKVYDGRMPEELIYPRDLIESHDKIQKLVKEKGNEALREKFKKRYDKLSRYSYVDEELGLMIRPCETQAEMIKEGELLHHCVGMYATSHAEGRTSIFFIRLIDAPSVPYYTLEYKSGHVAQNEGCHHKQRTREVTEFEKRWLDHVNKINSKESKKNERDHRSKDVRAGA